MSEKENFKRCIYCGLKIDEGSLCGYCKRVIDAIGFTRPRWQVRRTPYVVR